MSYSVTADEIVMAKVAELIEVDQFAFANLLVDLMVDPWPGSSPYNRSDPDDPMRLKPLGPHPDPRVLYWIDVDRRLVTVLDVVEDEQP